MRKNRRIIFSTLSALILAGILWQFLRPTEPTYEGKSLSQYLDQMARMDPGAYYDDTFKPIRHMGSKAVPYLRKALRKKDSVYVKTLINLQSLLPAGLARHVPAQNPQRLHDTAIAAAYCLGALGSDAKQTLPDLIDCFGKDVSRREDVYLLNSTWLAVKQIGPQADNLPALLTLLNSTNKGLAQDLAADCIGQIRITNAAVLSSLTKLAESTNQLRSRSALTALGELGDKAVPTVPALKQLLNSPDPSIRIFTASALQKIQGKHAIPVTWIIHELGQELDQEPKQFKGRSHNVGLHEVNLLYLCNMLSDLKTEAIPALSLLRTVRQNDYQLLKLASTRALWEINHETNGLVSICREHFDDGVGYQAASLFNDYCLEQRIDSPELHKMLKDRELAIQFLAARTLAKLNVSSDKILPIMTRALESHFISGEWQSELQCHAAEALAEMGPKARPAIPALTVALKDPNEKVRTAAALALKQIDPFSANKAGVK